MRERHYSSGTDAEDHAYDALRYGLATERRRGNDTVGYFKITRT